MGERNSAEVHNEILRDITQKLISLDYFVLWEYHYYLPQAHTRKFHEADILAIEKNKKHAHVIEVNNPVASYGASLCPKSINLNCPVFLP